MNLVHLFRNPALTATKRDELLISAQSRITPEIEDIQTEYCFNIAIKKSLSLEEMKILSWLLSETFEPENLADRSFIDKIKEQGIQKKDQFMLIEVGPRMNFTTAWSTNAVSICNACGLESIMRIERSRRYLLRSKSILTREQTQDFVDAVHDRMTECHYAEPLTTFESGIRPETVYDIPLIEEGLDALNKINFSMGLGLDEWDKEYYYNFFVKELGRNPTNVECFDLSQSNSEHSRHWFFKGKLIVDGVESPHNLIDLIQEPLRKNPNNSIIAFKDNSSSILGYEISTIVPEKPGGPSKFVKDKLLYDIIFTAETHNFPSGVAPFPGAETGTGGRIRDVEATGRGGLVIAGTAAYCVGSLLIPGYDLPWEDSSFDYPSNLASPIEIEIEASNGASDYGNKFGEPVIQGFTRSFGMRLTHGERYEWIKPIMFTGGIGQMDARHRVKGEPERDMLVVKIGGPAYRIGIGGGAASSMIQGENVAELDFNAVQRGDAEMEQKLNRVLRACIELGEANPIISIHDQGAGGNCNVVKEIIYPEGARIDIRNIQVGDDTLSVLEIWGAEYQEQNALLIHAKDVNKFKSMCEREKVSSAIIGEISGDGRVVLFDKFDSSTPVDLPLEKILGDMPQKTFHMDRVPIKTEPLSIPDDLSVKDVLERVLRLLSVGSKRFLTNKVDRSVTGLIARQQCTGPLHLTISDVGVVSQSHFGITGSAISIGEQPIKTLIDPAAMARMSVGEALTNMVWAKISDVEDIKCSGNWMWAAKLPGEGAKLYDAAVALSDILAAIGIAIDGGKDSLSMATQVNRQNTELKAQSKDKSEQKAETEIVKSPGTLVISAYATCPDVTKVVTPDIKRPGESRILFIDLGKGKNRLGGSSLAHVYKQIGNESPDVDDPGLLKRAFTAVQLCIEKDHLLSGHDRSDGGLIVTLLEMAFAGNCGMDVEFRVQSSEFRINDEAIADLFSEELGLVIEYLPEKEKEITTILENRSIPYEIIGAPSKEKRIRINFQAPDSKLSTLLDEDMRELREIWEETSYQLEKLQTDPEHAEEERQNNFDRKGPSYSISFEPSETPKEILERENKPRIAIVREEGSNSDREMTSAFYQAGFDTWDISMTDFLEGRVSLSEFRGVAFVGGFSYADVLDSAKGWAGVIRYNQKIWDEFQDFYHREDTFSLGVCNGCQLMALMGWVPWQGINDSVQPRFIHNSSGRFESRFSTVRIFPGPSIMFKGMEDSILGIWVAHGEGQAYFPDEEILKEIDQKDLAPVRYVDDNNEITKKYPFNPNGSAKGIAALCSADGRHLAIMPHPERTFIKWQWPWMPEDWKNGMKASPWLKMFQNAREWCE